MLQEKIFRMRLSPSELASLKSHRFVGTDRSILSKYVIGHYTRWLVEKVPRGIAPNMLTLGGYVMMLASLLLTLVFDPWLNSAPKYLPLANFALMFIYFTLDNLDGAQARRTNSGSPLGQLLDHGVDSNCALITSITLSSSLGLGLSQAFVALAFTIMTQFYLAGLEEKFTGHFVLAEISGASEGIALVMVLHLVSFVCGRQVFQHLLSDAFLWPVKRIYSFLPWLRNLQAISVIIMVTSAFNVVMSLASIRSRSSRKMAFYLSVARVATLVASFVTLYNALRAEGVGLQYLNILIFGQVFSIKYISEIYSYIVKSDVFIFMPPYLLYLFISAVLQIESARPYAGAILKCSFLLSSSHYFMNVAHIVGSLTDALGIRFLSIGKQE